MIRAASDRFATVVAVVFAVGLFAALWWRFRYAIDLTDETFSIALPYRFVRGDRPFIDELSTAQTSGLVLFPFIWLHVKLLGTTGLVLFVRHVHLLFKSFAAVATWFLARRWLTSKSARLVVAMTPFAFVPHSIPNVGYNVLACTLLVVGGFCSAAAIATDDVKIRERLLVASGFGYALGTFAYPPIAPAPILGALLLFALAPTARVRSVLLLAAGAGIVLLLVSPPLLRAGRAAIIASFKFGTAMVARPPSKMTQVLKDWWARGAPLVAWTYGLALVGFLSRSRTVVKLVVPMIVYLAATWWSDPATPSALVAFNTVTFAGLLAPAVLLLAEPDPVWRGAVLIIVPAWVAGHATAYGSSNGTDNGGIGMLPATVAFVVLAVRALEQAKAERTWAITPAMLFSALLAHRSFTFVYRDAPIAQCTARIRSGPFKGIWTTPARAKEFAELEDVFKRYDQPGGRVLIVYEQPGAYLFSRMPPSANTVWPLSWFGQPELRDYWNAHRTGKGIVIKFGGVNGPIDPEIAPESRVLERHGGFTVYREP